MQSDRAHVTCTHNYCRKSDGGVLNAGGRHALLCSDVNEPQPTYHITQPAYATPCCKQACRALAPDVDPRLTRLQPRPRTMQTLSLGRSLDWITYWGAGGEDERLRASAALMMGLSWSTWSFKCSIMAVPFLTGDTLVLSCVFFFLCSFR